MLINSIFQYVVEIEDWRTFFKGLIFKLDREKVLWKKGEKNFIKILKDSEI